MVKQLLLLVLAASPLAMTSNKPSGWDLPREITQQERWGIILREIREHQFPAIQQGPLSQRTCGLVRLSLRVEAILDSIKRNPEMIYSSSEFRSLHSATVGAINEGLIRDNRHNLCPGTPDAEIAELAVRLTDSYMLQVEEDDLSPSEKQRLQQLATNRTPR
jgi:hypothetical protein